MGSAKRMALPMSRIHQARADVMLFPSDPHSKCATHSQQGQCCRFGHDLYVIKIYIVPSCIGWLGEPQRVQCIGAAPAARHITIKQHSVASRYLLMNSNNASCHGRDGHLDLNPCTGWQSIGHFCVSGCTSLVIRYIPLSVAVLNIAELI